jgi:hypothetical protein
MDQKALLNSLFRRLEAFDAKLDRLRDEVANDFRAVREEQAEQLEVLKDHTQRSTRNEEELRVVRQEFKVLAGETSKLQMHRQFWAGVGKTLTWIFGASLPVMIGAGITLWRILHGG